MMHKNNNNFNWFAGTLAFDYDTLLRNLFCKASSFTSDFCKSSWVHVQATVTTPPAGAFICRESME
jgi:hypothetical protein